MDERPTTHGDFILGFEGLAIMRAWGLDPDTVSARVQSIAELVRNREEMPWANPVVEREVAVEEGYGRRAAGYPSAGNPVVLAEEPVVRGLIDGYTVGEALDAGCGTGRYAAYLTSLGHSVVGIDVTPEMLDEARRRVPEARFELADLAAIPLQPDAVDLVVCALALTHCAELGPAVGHLARVLRRGGHVVISDVHPVSVMLGVHSRFRLEDGEFGFVRNHLHLLSDYLAAFGEAGLTVVQCQELPWGKEEIAALGLAGEQPGLLEAAVEGLPAVVVWELRKRP